LTQCYTFGVPARHFLEIARLFTKPTRKHA
jgi:hypothetical protein